MNRDPLPAIETTLRERNMLNHPFYQAWSEGKLTKEMLKEYACQYYHFVREFPRMVSAVHSNVPDLATRGPLLLNLMDEEMGPENHPELWRRFARSVGATDEEIENSVPLASTTALVGTMMEYCRNHSYQEGVATLYAYEAQIPEVSKTKIAGLKELYGISSEDALKFFTVHEAADVLHSQSERDLISGNTPEVLGSAVIDAARNTTEALWKFLDGVHEAYVVPGGVEC